MLLKISYMGENSIDLGFLLHKNPYRPQEFQLTYGKAYVFYPLVSKEKTTVALLIDLNQVDLARGKLGSKEGGLFDYVNDRPYVSSSFLCSAISKVFSSALQGKCDKRPDLVSENLDLEVEISMLPCSANLELVDKIFMPLGYEVNYKTYSVDEKFPEWGTSRYITLFLKNKITLSSLLKHLYVLIPVFDTKKHYWFNEDEIEKLRNHGKEWLNDHPEKELIISRYLNYKKSLINNAKSLFLDDEDYHDIDFNEEATKDNLNDIRMKKVAEVIENLDADSVLDLGCGEGKLLSLLIKKKSIKKITGVDVSIKSLERASQRLKLDKIDEKYASKVNLLQGSITYRDSRFENYDCISIIEVIEHLDLDRLEAFQRVIFEFAYPKYIIITTPNSEYNEKYLDISKDKMRHSDHRFEWTRDEFQEWASKTAKEYGYKVEFFGIGESDQKCGEPTQMGVFRR